VTLVVSIVGDDSATDLEVIEFNFQFPEESANNDPRNLSFLEQISQINRRRVDIERPVCVLYRSWRFGAWRSARSPGLNINESKYKTYIELVPSVISSNETLFIC
jgi:hypothetical protein